MAARNLHKVLIIGAAHVIAEKYIGSFFCAALLDPRRLKANLAKFQGSNLRSANAGSGAATPKPHPRVSTSTLRGPRTS